MGAHTYDLAADLAALPARLAPLARPEKPARVDARQEPDVWSVRETVRLPPV
ncbi:MAG: hypothetical protein ACRDOH_33665 [Streptosporangiaceae bacterium]